MVLVEDFERRLGQILDLVNSSKGLVVVEDYELVNRSNQPKEENHKINPYNDIVRFLGPNLFTMVEINDILFVK